MYLNICTYMSQQMQLMYTEAPCSGENKRTQKITQNTRKFILRRATKVTISKFRGWRRKKQNCACAVFFGGSHGKKNAHLQLFFEERWLRWLAINIAMVSSLRVRRCKHMHKDAGRHTTYVCLCTNSCVRGKKAAAWGICQLRVSWHTSPSLKTRDGKPPATASWALFSVCHLEYRSRAK